MEHAPEEATDGAIQQEITEGLQNWFEGNDAPPSNQTRIGWFQLLLGYINSTWVERQERHYRDTRAIHKSIVAYYCMGTETEQVDVEARTHCIGKIDVRL